MSKVPLDIITDMLYRLPVKALLRFRSLSKYFCSLIDSPDFINIHLDHSLSSKAHLVLALKGLHLYTADLNSLNQATPFDFYPQSIWGVTEVFGSCNGLLALCNSEKDIYILNPSTKHLLNLPISDVEYPLKGSLRGFVFYGFGFDLVSEDYKVVRMVQFKRNEEDNLGIFLDYEVKVYSLKLNCWKKVVNLPSYVRLMFQFYYHLLHRRGYGVYTRGVLHWVFPRRVELGIGDSIVGFDLGTEEFRVVGGPEYGELEEDFVVDVGALEGCLCLVCNYGRGVVDLWVMKEYGVKESWSKVFSIDQSRISMRISFLKPLVWWKGSGGEENILMELNNQKIMWYDLRRRRFKTVRIRGCPDSFGADVYVESLIPVDKGRGGGRNGKEQKDGEKKKETNRKKR